MESEENKEKLTDMEQKKINKGNQGRGKGRRDEERRGRRGMGREEESGVEMS